jgi:DNA-binding response OmpR family regulator
MQARLPDALGSSSGLTRILIVKCATADPVIEVELSRQGYQVNTIDSRKLEPLTFYKAPPDLIILDGRHSHLKSLEICQSLRRLSQVPIILLSSICELSDSNTGFEAGADDCISHPFQMEELLARIRVRLRYAHKEKPPVLQIDNLTLNCQNRKAYWSDQEIKLTSKEFDLLKYFMIHDQRVIPRYELMEHLWGAEYDVSSNVVEAYICRLRFKLEKCSHERLIQTVYGVGYKLRPSINSSLTSQTSLPTAHGFR